MRGWAAMFWPARMAIPRRGSRMVADVVRVHTPSTDERNDGLIVAGSVPKYSTRGRSLPCR